MPANLKRDCRGRVGEAEGLGVLVAKESRAIRDPRAAQRAVSEHLTKAAPSVMTVAKLAGFP
jgi:hypothetical protein